MSKTLTFRDYSIIQWTRLDREQVNSLVASMTFEERKEWVYVALLTAQMYAEDRQCDDAQRILDVAHIVAPD